MKSIPAEALQAINKMKGGEYYNQSTIDGDLARIKDYVGTLGRETAARAVPIFPPDKIAETKPDYVLILPWNLKDEIAAQLAYIRDWGGQFVVPIPALSIF